MKTFVHLFEQIAVATDNNIVLKLHTGLFGRNNDVLFISVYIPPPSSVFRLISSVTVDVRLLKSYSLLSF